MSRTVDLPSTDAPTVAAPRVRPRLSGRLGPSWSRRLRAAQGTSLARRFLLANLAILLVAGLAVGLWVGEQLERGIVERTASVTALYVDSIIEPSIASLASGSELTPAEIGTLDSHLASSPLVDRVRSLRVWSPDGRVVYSPNASLIGETFPVEGNLAKAWQGDVVAGMDDLSGAENAWERARWKRLLEIYIPVRERGSDRIIAVAEFYLPPREIDRQVADARFTSWLVVTMAILASAALLFGIVKQGSDTIKRQEVALTQQVDELTGLIARNAALSERVRTAAERSTTLNERSLRRVSADIHDGPGQMLSLALLRLDAMRKRAVGGRSPETAEVAEVEEVLQDAMTDMRAIAAGLRLPELDSLDVRAVVTRAVTDHQRRSGTNVALVIADDVPRAAPLPVKIALFRALGEALSNATRHGRGTSLAVEVTRAPTETDGRPERLVLAVTDDGVGFDPAALSTTAGLGLAGIREQAELLGGGFAIESAPGQGTHLRVWWPVHGVADEG